MHTNKLLVRVLGLGMLGKGTVSAEKEEWASSLLLLRDFAPLQRERDAPGGCGMVLDVGFCNRFVCKSSLLVIPPIYFFTDQKHRVFYFPLKIHF